MTGPITRIPAELVNEFARSLGHEPKFVSDITIHAGVITVTETHIYLTDAKEQS